MWLGKEEEKPLTAEPFVPELKTNSSTQLYRSKPARAKPQLVNGGNRAGEARRVK